MVANPSQPAPNFTLTLRSDIIQRMLVKHVRDRKGLAIVGRWLVALLVAFQAQLALAACLSAIQSPAFAYKMAGQATDQSSPCQGMPASDSAICLGHCLQSYQATDKQTPLADGLPAIEHSAEPPTTYGQAVEVLAEVVASPSSPPPRILFCCLRN